MPPKSFVLSHMVHLQHTKQQQQPPSKSNSLMQTRNKNKKLLAHGIKSKKKESIQPSLRTFSGISETAAKDTLFKSPIGLGVSAGETHFSDDKNGGPLTGSNDPAHHHLVSMKSPHSLLNLNNKRMSISGQNVLEE